MRNLLLILCFTIAASSGENHYVPRNGDIVFQTSRSAQSEAIQLATESPYSHMGIVYLQDGGAQVLEAVQPVKLTPLEEWVKRGENGHFVAKRLVDADAVLTPEVLQEMQAVGQSLTGKDYDLYFEWSDERVYCSELVWKIFDLGADIEIGSLAKLGSFDLSHPVVRAKVEERYGGNVPSDEPVISPAAMFDSPLLEVVFEN